MLCYLDGKTRDEAAQRLGWSLGTLKRRLEQGRACLRARLARRGLAMSTVLVAAGVAPGSTPARVPATLATAALQATRHAAPTAVVALADGAARTLFATGTGAITALVLLAGFVTWALAALTPGAPHERPGSPAAARTAGVKAAPREARAEVNPDAGAQLTVRGKVLDAQGKPLPGAKVAALSQRAQANSSSGGETLPFTDLKTQLLGQGTTDRDGNYRIAFARSSFTRGTEGDPWVTVVGLAPGHAVGWEAVQVKGGPAGEAVVRLRPAEPVRGRLFDLQGQPAARVALHVVRVARTEGGRLTGLKFTAEAAGLAAWPARVVTDAGGRFTLSGVDRTLGLTARVHGDRFALHDLVVKGGEKEEIALALAPPRILEGRVLRSDTRTPVAGIEVRAVAYPGQPAHNIFLSQKTDAEGRFRFNHYAAERYDLRTDDLEGQPYFAINFIDVNWPRDGKIKHTVDVLLPRGVVQRGKVVDEAGKPVAGARVLYLPKLYNNPNIDGDPIDLWQRQIGRAQTRQDGTFRIAVLPGPGHLVIQGPYGQDFSLRWMDHKDLFGHDKPGPLWYGHGFIKVDARKDGKGVDVLSTIQRAVSIPIEVVDRAGKAATGAQAMVLEFADETRMASQTLTEVKDGRAELRRCAPNETYHVVVFDAKNGQGALATIRAAEAREPRRMRLQACGSAGGRLLDAKGNPLTKYRYRVAIRHKWQGDKGDGRYLLPPGIKDSQMFATDAEGRWTQGNLVPGLTYVLTSANWEVIHEFTAEAGKTAALGDLTVRPKK
jgi:protocatechuate 3,4-dioxygenase beta subunit